jgi:apolipoprotein N-acyltransferase
MPSAVTALIILCAYLSLFPALSFWILTKFRRLHPFSWASVAAALWMLFEWLRGNLFTGFPWLALGYSQAPFSPLAGFAPIIGVYGISLLAGTQRCITISSGLIKGLENGAMACP